MVALKRLGFRMKMRAAGLTTMCRYANAVVVPESATLSPTLVAAILRAAGVDPVDFLRVIERRSPPSTRPHRAVA